jgi:hypothetical protein
MVAKSCFYLRSNGTSSNWSNGRRIDSIPKAIGVESSLEAPESLDAVGQMKMYVYFTVDTESSIGGAWEHADRRPVAASRHIFCRIENEDFGIPLLTRIMGEFGFRGTYFVETLATPCMGESDTRSVFDFLLRKEQDVQLHIHPVFRLYSAFDQARRQRADSPKPRPMDLIGHLNPNAQLDLLGEAIGYFETFAGYRPLVFRAGCFAGSRSTLRCLYELGVRVDSSFNPCYHPEISFPLDPLEPNLVQKIEGVWEIPITVARTRLPEARTGFKFADCTSLSFPEIRTMLEATAAAGQQHFVIVFHSFSAVKARDETYAEMRPNRIVIRRLEQLFRYLAANDDKYCVQTMGDIAGNLEVLEQGSHVRVVPNLSFVTAAKRKAVQLINNAYWL